MHEFSSNKNEFDDNPDYQMLLDKLEEFIQLMPEKRKQVFIKKKIEGKSLKKSRKSCRLLQRRLNIM